MPTADFLSSNKAFYHSDTLLVTAKLETRARICNNHFHQKSYLNFSVMYFYGPFDLIS